MLLGPTQTLQRRVVDLRSELLDWQRRQMFLVEECDFRAGVENECEPAAAVDRAANRWTETLDEEILIADRPARGSENAAERGVAMAEIELDAKLLQQMRAE